MKNDKIWRRTGAFLAASVLLSALWAPAAWAAGDVKMTSSVGWDGTFKLDAPTFVQVTLDNQGAEDLNGKVVIGPLQGQPSEIPGLFEKEVVLPKGSTKTVRIEVPGGLFRTPVVVELLDENGVKIDDQQPSQIAIQEGILLGGITEKKDDLNVFSLLSSPLVGGKVNLRWMKNADLPDRALLLEGLDMLAVNHAPQEKLNDEQVEAIRQWVAQGGVLLLSGGPNYQGGASLFQDLSPVQVSGTGKATDLTDLERFTGVKPSVNELNVSTGTLAAEAEVLVKSQDLPLLAKRDYGAGQVLYAAYDLSEEPFASWQGNKELWGNLLQDAEFDASFVPNKGYGGPRPFDSQQSLVYASQMFRDILPKIKTSAVLFFGYVILVGPVMYLVLRRFNRREWGWALIPASALLVTAGLLVIDNGPRNDGTRAQTTAVVHIKTDKVAQVSAGTSFLVTSGGDYEVEFAKGAFVYPARSNYGGFGEMEARTVSSDDKPKIRFENVEYWSMRSSYLQGTLSDQGQLTSDLRLDLAGRVVGQVTNNTRYPLTHAHLLIGNHVVKIDDLPVGETVKIDVDASSNTMQPGGIVYGHGYGYQYAEQMFPRSNMQMNDDMEQHRNLVHYATTPWEIRNSRIQLFAFSATPLNLYTVDGKQVNSNDDLTLVHQELNLAYDESGSKVPAGMIRAQVVAQEGQVYIEPEGIRVVAGSVTIQYKLRDRANFTVEKVTTNLDESQFAMYDKQLYNFKTGQWDLVSKQNTPELSGEGLASYISSEGEFRVKLTSITPHDQFLQYPNVGLEGRVSP